ncbi:MAG: dihydrofolate reductase family protein [Actinobacteria bacterium]|nr:dihydrofolate reductase family protein [Actinomycetota bacterium]
MGKVIVNAAVSLDGYIADESGAVGPLFDYYFNGDVEVTLGDPDRIFKVTPRTAEYLHRFRTTNLGCVVIGRNLFNLTNGWNGRPATGEAVFVVTHQPPADWSFHDAPYTFVSDGVAAAITRARDFAGDRDVSVTAGNVGGQAIEAGLVDEVHMNLVPVLFGSGVRFFGDYGGACTLLDDPQVVQGRRVTHLIYDLR